MPLNIDKIRQDFPILSREVHGKPLVYLDNAATTQKPLQVLHKIEEVYATINSNIHRGIHYLSQQATESHEEARKTVQRFINARNASEIVFTRGTTEAINLIASSFCRSQCRPGDEILISVMEHHSNIVPWQLQQETAGINLKVIPIDEKGEICMNDLEQAISPKTRLIAITHISNVLGTINPVGEIIRRAHLHDIPVLIDAAQSVQHLPIDVQELDCDFLAFSSHKIYGPTGIGVLYGKEDWLDRIPPYQGGGEMIARVSFEKTTFNELPFKFEAGTPDYVGSAALAEALRYITHLGLEPIRRHEAQLLDYATAKLTGIDRLRIIGTAPQKSSVISFLVDAVHPYDMGLLLDQFGIALRTGHHCAQPLMDFLGIEGTLRCSFAFYNTTAEIDILVDAIRKVSKMF
ncbi:MAG: cysteine desulfurase [Dysgonamonadaceae bacterium]|nr:cysteine desulfurase [Dysgonamonadaceae bacterium]